VVLFFTDPATGHRHGCYDGWAGGWLFHNVGEGQRGDQRLIRGNAAILNHRADRRTLEGFLARFGVERGLPWPLLAAVVVAVGVVAVRRAAHPADALALNAFVALLASPVSWTNHWVWCVPILLAAWRSRPALAAGGVVLFVVTPHLWWDGGPMAVIVGNAYLWCAVAVLACHAAGLRERLGATSVARQRQVRPVTRYDAGMQPGDEEELAERARRGDAEALDQLLSRIRPGVLRWCARFLGTQDAEEACQDVLWAVAKNIDRFEGKSRFQTWLHAIASNRALDTYRRLKRRAGEQPVEQLPTVVEGRTTSVIAGTRIDLLEALDQLRKDKPDLVEPVVLRELGDLTYQEIADRLGLPIDTVKTHIRRGRLYLRDHLATQDR
jgi:RNA polymerase sigma-70 factor, ECF subfamily